MIRPFGMARLWIDPTRYRNNKQYFCTYQTHLSSLSLWPPAPRLPRARHQQSQPRRIVLIGPHRTQAAAADHGEPSAQRSELVEIARDQQHRAALGGECGQPPAHLGGGGDVEPAGNV